MKNRNRMVEINVKMVETFNENRLEKFEERI